MTEDVDNGPRGTHKKQKPEPDSFKTKEIGNHSQRQGGQAIKGGDGDFRPEQKIKTTSYKGWATKNRQKVGRDRGKRYINMRRGPGHSELLQKRNKQRLKEGGVLED